MKIGVSMPPAFLCGQAASVAQEKMLAAFGGIDGWLREIYKAGANHIEMRSVKEGITEETVRGAMDAAARNGFSVTVHGALAEEAAEIFWGRFLPVLSKQPELTVTVHSIIDRETTMNTLRRLAEYGMKHHPGARLALENNRIKGDTAPLVSCEGVLATVKALKLPNLGICWDFGHLYWDYQTHPELISGMLPPEGYADRAIHTHIHSVAFGRTHFPLSMGEAPLSEYVSVLKRAGYEGVFNFEPEPERWPEGTDVPGEMLRSVRILKETVEAI